jgi:hypothetical protein
VKPGSHPVYQPGAGHGGAGGAVVSWSLHGALHPTSSQARCCPGTVAFGTASATTIRVRASACARAKRMHARVLGFPLSHQGLEFRARRGQSEFSFVLYWIDCGC